MSKPRFMPLPNERLADRNAARPSRDALIGTLIGNAPGLVLPFAITAHFGIGRVTDAYVFAFAGALFGASLASGVLEANVLPAATLMLSRGGAGFRRFAERIALQASLVSLLFYPLVVTAVALFVVRHGGWTHDERHTTLVMSTGFVSLVCFVSASSALAGSVYALGDFLTPTTTQALRSVAALSALPFLGRHYADVELLPLILAAGEAARITVLVVRIRLSNQRRGGAASAPRTPPVWRFAAPHAFNMIVLAVNPVVDRAVATTLSPGSTTVLDLAEKIFSGPMTVVVSSVVLVAGARWASLNSEGAAARLAADYRRTVQTVTAVAASLAALTALAVIVAAPLARAHFGSAGSKVVLASVVLLSGIPTGSIATLSARLLTSARRTAALPIFAVTGVASNLVGDVVGVHIWGLYGIVGATVVTSSLNAVLLVGYCRRLLARSIATTGEDSVEAAGSSGASLITQFPLPIPGEPSSVGAGD